MKQYDPFDSLMALFFGGSAPDEENDMPHRFTDGYGANTKYNAIRELHKKLEEENIPHTFERSFDGYRILYYGHAEPSKYSVKGDVIEHRASYGNEDDLLEVAGCFVKRDDDVEGYLTAEEVFARIKADYKNT